MAGFCGGVLALEMVGIYSIISVALNNVDSRARTRRTNFTRTRTISQTLVSHVHPPKTPSHRLLLLSPHFDTTCPMLTAATCTCNPHRRSGLAAASWFEVPTPASDVGEGSPKTNELAAVLVWQLEVFGAGWKLDSHGMTIH